VDITFNCDKCGQSLTIDEAGAGQLVDCPKCGKPLEVPYKSKPLDKAATPAPSPPPAPRPGKTARASSPLRKILTVLVIIVALVGGLFTFNLWRTQQPARAEAAPVTELQEVMKLFAAKSEATNYSFDVTKTDSLVSPNLGTVEYRFADGLQSKAIFAYQEKKWALKKICYEQATRIEALPVIRWCDDDRMSDASTQTTPEEQAAEETKNWAAQKFLLPHLMMDREQWEDALKIKYSRLNH
jgi:hypothetical protein